MVLSVKRKSCPCRLEVRREAMVGREEERLSTDADNGER
jgi:hypothetical protein